eukprot:scaffold154188_cov13-Tisochrysis_lutea.AAC.1
MCASFSVTFAPRLLQFLFVSAADLLAPSEATQDPLPQRAEGAKVRSTPSSHLRLPHWSATA